MNGFNVFHRNLKMELQQYENRFTSWLINEPRRMAQSPIMLPGHDSWLSIRSIWIQTSISRLCRSVSEQALLLGEGVIWIDQDWWDLGVHFSESGMQLRRRRQSLLATAEMQQCSLQAASLQIRLDSGRQAMQLLYS
jgi:hypothetical protein